MASESNPSTSYWMDSANLPEEKTLTGSLKTEVCVIGAGIAGLTTAYLLTCEGKAVVVLEGGEIGGGQTERTTAHLSNAIDDRYYEIERLHGRKGAKLAAQSHTTAIDRIEAIVRKENIKCDFERVDGYLFVPEDESIRTLQRELAAAHRAGLGEVELIPRAPMTDFETGPCLRFPRQGQFHPTKYLAGLVEAIQRQGGRIYTHTRAGKIQSAANGAMHVLTNDGPVITAQSVVVATNNPINDLLALNIRLAAYRTYVIGVEVPSGSVEKALYWDTLDPYHYVRIQPNADGDTPDTDLLIVGGEDHRTGQEDDGDERYASLEQWTREHFPMSQAVKFRWSGQVMESMDGLAYIGRDLNSGPNVYIATGDSGMGMTHGTIAGILLSDLIGKRPNPWTALYDPARFTLAAVPDLAQEGASTVWQYTDWLTGGDVEAVRQIEPGSGAVVRRGLKKLAIYRDEEGALHPLSAVCPHLGCIVAWNTTESTWDCPCHGSQFDACGKVINGPAHQDLEPLSKTIGSTRTRIVRKGA